MYKSKIESFEGLRRIAMSKHVARLLNKEDLHLLRTFLNEHPSCPIDETPSDLFDSIYDELTNSEETTSYYIESSDESSDGSWPATIFGFAGVWLFQSSDMDDCYFTDREEAISHLMDCAHSSISVEEDTAVQPWQKPE